MTDIYLLNGETTLRLPVAPEELPVETAAQFQTWNILGRGEVVRPRGNAAARWSIECFLPGAARAEDPWWAEWRPPLEIVAVLGQWKANGAVVRCLVTDGSQVSGWDAYLEQFRRIEAGGHGDLRYVLTFIEARSLRVLTDEEEAAEASLASLLAAQEATALEAALPMEPARPATYVVTEDDAANGDSWLGVIARRFYGDAERWSDLYWSNDAAIQGVTGTPDSNVPAVGAELVLP